MDDRFAFAWLWLFFSEILRPVPQLPGRGIFFKNTASRVADAWQSLYFLRILARKMIEFVICEPVGLHNVAVSSTSHISSFFYKWPSPPLELCQKYVWATTPRNAGHNMKPAFAQSTFW